MRAETHFEVIAPDTPEESGPVLALAPGLDYQGEDRDIPVVELPAEVDGIKLFKGMILTGFGQLFKRDAGDIRPHELRVVSESDETTVPPAAVEVQEQQTRTAAKNSTWSNKGDWY
jgi:hypothetical protein